MALVERTITGIYKDADGNLLTGKTIEFMPMYFVGGGGIVVPKQPVKIVTNATTAAFSLSLYTSNAPASFVRYEVIFHTGDRPRFDLINGPATTLDDLINAYAGAAIMSDAALIAELLNRIIILESRGDVTAPTVPTAIVLQSLGMVSFQASWAASTDLSIIDAVVAAPEMIVAAIQHNLTVTFDQFVLLRNTTNAPQTITGITGGNLGAVKQLVNRGTATIILAGENVLSVATNRFAYAAVLNPGGMLTIIYNGTRWEVFQ